MGLLHIITRILKPLLPLSLGAAVNAFISHSSGGSYPIPMPFGTSPYPYIFTSVILFFLTSRDGIPAMVVALGSRIGEQTDSVLESAYVSHLLGLSLGDGASVKSRASLYPSGAFSRALEALLVVKAVVLDGIIGVVVLGLLFGWEVALGVFVFLAIYSAYISYTSSAASVDTSLTSIRELCPHPYSLIICSALHFVSGISCIRATYPGASPHRFWWSSPRKSLHCARGCR